MDTAIFSGEHIAELHLENHNHCGGKKDKCKIEYRIKNRKRVFKFAGYIQSIMLRNETTKSPHGMIFGGHTILLDLKRVTVYNMEHLPGQNNYDIEVVI